MTDLESGLDPEPAAVTALEGGEEMQAADVALDGVSRVKGSAVHLCHRPQLLCVSGECLEDLFDRMPIPRSG